MSYHKQLFCHVQLSLTLKKFWCYTNDVKRMILMYSICVNIRDVYKVLQKLRSNSCTYIVYVDINNINVLF